MSTTMSCCDSQQKHLNSSVSHLHRVRLTWFWDFAISKRLTVTLQEGSVTDADYRRHNKSIKSGTNRISTLGNQLSVLPRSIGGTAASTHLSSCVTTTCKNAWPQLQWLFGCILFSAQDGSFCNEFPFNIIIQTFTTQFLLCFHSGTHGIKLSFPPDLTPSLFWT